jgi:hypothetical protein
MIRNDLELETWNLKLKKEAGTFGPTSSQKENIFLIHVFL